MDDVKEDVVRRCLQQLNLLPLHLAILGYIPGPLNGLEYLRRTDVFIGDNLTIKLLRKMFKFDNP